MRMGSCVLSVNSNKRNLLLYRKSVDDCYWKDSSGHHTFCSFPYHLIGMYSNNWCGLRVNGWSHMFDLKMTSTHKFRRLLRIFRVTSVPQKFSCEWWNTTRVVYCRYHWCGDFYIGSTEHSVFDRQQSRIRKYRQLPANQVACYEPASKMWHRRQNIFEFCIFLVILVWIHPNDGTTLLTMEQLFQQTFCPVYTWPWINLTLFSKNGKRKTTFWSQVDSSRLYTWTEDGQKIQKKTQGTIELHFESTTGQQHQDLQILYALGSNSQRRFDCSKFLRSTQNDTECPSFTSIISQYGWTTSQHIYPTLEQDTEDCPELRYFASHSILSVGTNSPHFDTCIPSWIATSSDSRFSRIIGQYWWKTSHKQTQIRRWEIAECVSPSISFERSIALCWKILPRKGPVCVYPAITNRQ